MPEPDKFPLALRSPSAVEKAETGARRVLSGMVADTLALATKEQFASAKSKLRTGEYEWCEPDYQQLMSWAEQLKMAPLEVLRRLKEGLRRKGDETRIENGKFIKLNWDPGLLPVSEFQISFPIELTDLSFAPIDAIDDCKDTLKDLDGVPADGQLPEGYCLSARVVQISTTALPKLRRLDCAASIGLKNLAMASASALERLDCSWNLLSTLDLGSFPNLRELACSDNGPLESLDLRCVPELLELNCQGNLIRALDLRPVPKLQRLNCSDSDMQELVPPSLPELVELDCENSSWDKSAGLGRYLEKLDLRGVPNLRRLNCFSNALDNLDLSCVPQLRDLNCVYNLLVDLDVSCVPMLEVLRCENCSYESVWIKTLDVRPLFHLKELHYDKRTRLIQRPDQHFHS